MEASKQILLKYPTRSLIVRSRHIHVLIVMIAVINFIVRSNEHLGISVLTGNNLSYNENKATAVRKHIHDCNHASCIDDFQIIGRARNIYFLKIKESIVIIMLKPTLNIAKESMPLQLF